MEFFPPPTHLSPVRSYTELTVGATFAMGGFALDREDILSFAADFDPQPFHLSDDVAEKSIFKGLVASGFQTMSATFSTGVRTGMMVAVNLGGAGFEAGRWRYPVRPGDRISVHWTIVSIEPSAKKPDRAQVKIRYDGLNQDDILVLTMVLTHLVSISPIA